MVSEREMREIKENIWKAVSDEWRARNPKFTPPQYVQFYQRAIERCYIEPLLEKYDIDIILKIAKSILSDSDFKLLQDIIERIESRKQRN